MIPLDDEERVPLRSTHPAARHVQDAQRHFEEDNAPECDRAFRRAIARTRDEPRVRCALMEDHLSKLMEFGWYAEAAALCADYLRQCPENERGFKLLELEIRSLQGRYEPDFEEVVAFIIAAGRLSGQRMARLGRVIGLREADQGSLRSALRYLEGSLRLCREFDPGNVGRLIEDITHFRALTGEQDVPTDGDPPQTAVDHLRRAERLRLSGHYQRAEHAALTALQQSGQDAALQWGALCELVRTLWGQRRPDAVEALRPLLVEAAGRTPDPDRTAYELHHLLEQGTTDRPVRRNFEQRVQDARRRLIEENPDAAEAELSALLQEECTPREAALWHLAKAECCYWRYRTVRHGSPFLAHCARNAARAVVYAQTDVTWQIRVVALRLLADALTESDAVDADDYAVECWAEAHRLEELIAGRPDSDAIRVGMLLPVPDEHDKRVGTALRRVLELKTPNAYGITVAIEAARGALILPRILPGETGRVRTLPRPADWLGAEEWLVRISAALARDQAAWLLHATEDRVIQSLVLPDGTCHHHYADLDRGVLAEAIDELGECCESPDTVELSASDGSFNRSADRLARLLAIDDVLDRLPRRIQRLAIIAGDEVSAIPFAALPPRGTGEPLGLRYGLSDLPCLSALDPLRRRAADRRGDSLLLVRPEGTGVAHGNRRMPKHDPLEDATAAGLRARLAQRLHRIVRIDTHGGFAYDRPEASLLQMSPDGDAGWLRSDELAAMDLGYCGTLMLGACESGMVRRIGRDERQGFVRAAFNAGAPAVLAARWVAKDWVTAAVLDRFQWHVRYLTRDLALRSAIRGVQAEAPEVAHWACWTLYGDSGPQTDAGALVRWSRGRSRRAHLA